MKEIGRVSVNQIESKHGKRFYVVFVESCIAGFSECNLGCRLR